MKYSKLKSLVYRRHTGAENLKIRMNLMDMLFIYSTRQGGIKNQGVAIVVEKKKLSNSLTSCYKISERIVSWILKTQTNETVIFQVYASNPGCDDTIVDFYDILQQKIELINKNSTIILLGDFNAKVEQTYSELITEVATLAIRFFFPRQENADAKQAVLNLRRQNVNLRRQKKLRRKRDFSQFLPAKWKFTSAKW